MKFMKGQKWIDWSDSDAYEETPSEVAGDDFSEWYGKNMMNHISRK